MSDSIEEKVRERALVRLTRGFAGAENVHGFLLAASPRLVLLQEVTELHLDGYRILDRTQIEATRHSRYERYMAAILRAEGELKKLGLDAEIDLADWETAFRSLKARGRSVIVEDEREETDAFLIGEILRVNKRSVSIREFDALGRWVAEPSRQRYTDVTSISFENEYVTIFSKYLRDG